MHRRSFLLLILATASAAFSPGSQSKTAPIVFKYEDFGPPAEVVSRERIDDLNLTLVTYSNGVHLTFRPSASEPGVFRLRLVFPVNGSHVRNTATRVAIDSDTRLVPNPFVAKEAAEILFLGNLRRHSHEEIHALLVKRQIEPEISVDNGTPQLTLKGPAAGLPFALRLVTAWLSDPLTEGPEQPPLVTAWLSDPTGPERIPLDPSGLKFRLLPMNPARLCVLQALSEAAGRDSRLGRIGAARTYITASDITDWLDQHLLRCPLEVGIAGDIDIDDVVKDAARNLGALAKRVPLPPQAPLIGPKKATRAQATSNTFPETLSMSCLLWPLNKNETPKETAAITVASAILRDALVRITTDAFKKPIDPQTWIHRDAVQRDFGFVVMVNSFASPVAGPLTDAILRTAVKFADVGVSEADFNRVRANVRQRRVTELTDNKWWLENVLWAAHTHPQVIEEAREHVSAIDALTATDVSTAAKLFTPKLAAAVILTGGMADRK